MQCHVSSRKPNQQVRGPSGRVQKSSEQAGVQIRETQLQSQHVQLLDFNKLHHFMFRKNFSAFSLFSCEYTMFLPQREHRMLYMEIMIVYSNEHTKDTAQSISVNRMQKV